MYKATDREKQKIKQYNWKPWKLSYFVKIVLCISMKRNNGCKKWWCLKRLPSIIWDCHHRHILWRSRQQSLTNAQRKDIRGTQSALLLEWDWEKTAGVGWDYEHGTAKTDASVNSWQSKCCWVRISYTLEGEVQSISKESQALWAELPTKLSRVALVRMSGTLQNSSTHFLNRDTTQKINTYGGVGSEIS